jgi:hypothetical protein
MPGARRPAAEQARTLIVGVRSLRRLAADRLFVYPASFGMTRERSRQLTADLLGVGAPAVPEKNFNSGYPPASCTRRSATHSALPQVRPEPRRGRPHRQAGRSRASQAA